MSLARCRDGQHARATPTPPAGKAGGVRSIHVGSSGVPEARYRGRSSADACARGGRTQAVDGHGHPMAAAAAPAAAGRPVLRGYRCRQPPRARASARASERAPADCCRECSWGRPLHPRPADHECDDRADQEHDEKDPGDAGRSGNDATKAEHRGDDRDDEEDDGVCSMVPSACAGSFRCKMSRTLGARAGVGTGSGAEARVGCGLRRACLRHT